MFNHYRFLGLTLALCILAAAVWYGSVFALESGSDITLTTISGDPEALDGVWLEGSLQDDTFAQQFAFEDGKFSTHFVPTEYVPAPYEPQLFAYRKFEPAPNGNTDGPVLEDENEDWKHYTLNTDRIEVVLQLHNYNDNSFQTEFSNYARISTGVICQGDPDQFGFQSSFSPEYDNEWYTSQELENWLYSFQNPWQNTNGAAVANFLGDELYAAINLPWGGAQVYHVTGMEPAPSQPAPVEEQINRWKDTQSIGSADLLDEYPSSEVTQVLDLLPLGDHLAVITLTASADVALGLDKADHLYSLEPPTKNQVCARIYDPAGNLVDSAVLLDLPADSRFSIRVLPCAPSGTGFDDLSMILEASVLYPDGRAESAVSAAASLRLESGRLTSVQKICYPASETAIETLDLTCTENTPRSLACVQPDETGTKLAVVWGEPAFDPFYPNFVTEQMFVDVLRDGKSLYHGELTCDWLDDDPQLLTPVQIGRRTQRYFSFDISNTVNKNSWDHRFYPISQQDY